MSDAEGPDGVPRHFPQFLPRAPNSAGLLYGDAQVGFVPGDAYADEVMVVSPRLSCAPAHSGDPVLAFVVARAFSKLVAIDPALIDMGALLRAATQLDARAPFNNKKATVAMPLGRSAAKLRGTGLGDLLIQTFGEGGTAARSSFAAGYKSARR